MSNPYPTPAFDPKQFQDEQAGYGPGGAYGHSNWVGQVRIFSVLNAIEGVLEVIAGLFAMATGVLLLAVGPMQEVRKNTEASEDLPPEQFFWLVGMFYLFIGIPVLISGVLRIVAGVQNFRFKGRTLGLISIIVGVIPAFSGCGAPTSLGLLVYGLIIHLDPAVKAAFDMARQGRTASQILAAFDSYQTAYPSPPQPPGGPGQSPTGGNSLG